MRSAGLLALSLLAACLGTSPEDAARDALGDYRGEGEPEHRPGQPCLTCHDFAIAGTVFLYADDEVGVSGALVTITDDAGHQFTAPTNRTGNFIVTVKSGIDSPRMTRRGLLQIPWEPVFPLRVVVQRGDVVREMESWIWREGSCAGCHHGGQDEADSVAKIFLLEEGA